MFYGRKWYVAVERAKRKRFECAKSRERHFKINNWSHVGTTKQYFHEKFNNQDSIVGTRHLQAFEIIITISQEVSYWYYKRIMNHNSTITWMNSKVCSYIGLKFCNEIFGWLKSQTWREFTEIFRMYRLPSSFFLTHVCAPCLFIQLHSSSSIIVLPTSSFLISLSYRSNFPSLLWSSR